MSIKKISIIFLIFLIAMSFILCDNSDNENNQTSNSQQESDNEGEKSNNSNVNTNYERNKLNSNTEKTENEETNKSNNKTENSDNGEVKMSDFENMSQEELKDYKAIIKTNYGEIHIEFFPEVAPNHVKNFLKLASSDFYDGTTFHRVIPGFMIQGGDPNSKDDDPTNDGTGGPGYSIDAEFSDVPHKRGILSMARSRNPNSAGSQFFIVQQDAPHLDGQYTVFGRVTDGLDVVDKIIKVDRDNRDRPIEDVKTDVDVMKK